MKKKDFLILLENASIRNLTVDDALFLSDVLKIAEVPHSVGSIELRFTKKKK